MAIILRRSTNQRDSMLAPRAGVLIYNTTTSRYNRFDGDVWHDLVPTEIGGAPELFTGIGDIKGASLTSTGMLRSASPLMSGQILRSPGVPATPTKNGTIVMVCQSRQGTSDDEVIAYIMRRSTDFGVTWDSPSLVYHETNYPSTVLDGHALVYDRIADKLFLFFTKNFAASAASMWVMESSDNGDNWSTPIDITSSVKIGAGATNPGGQYPATAWTSHRVGPGSGIQLQFGPNAGRLILPGYHRLDVGANDVWFHTIKSDDHGATWQLWGGVPQSTGINRSQEPSLCELTDGTLLATCRTNTQRCQTVSTDGGATFSAISTLSVGAELAEDCHACHLRLRDDSVLLSSPVTASDVRGSLGLYRSTDGGDTWSFVRTIDPRWGGYSNLCDLGPKGALIVYESCEGNKAGWEHINAARSNWRDITIPQAMRIVLPLNEYAAGVTALGTSATLRDHGDNDCYVRGNAIAVGNPAYAAINSGVGLALATGKYIKLADAGMRAYSILDGKDFTAEFRFTTAGDGTLLSTATAAPYLHVSISSGVVVVDVDDDDGGTVTLTGSTTVSDASLHTVNVVREAGTQWRLYVDGVLEDSDTDTTGDIYTALATDLLAGRLQDGSAEFTGTLDIIKLSWEEVVADNLINNSWDKPVPEAPPVYANSPLTLSGIQLWLPAWHPRCFATDPYGERPLPETIVAGQAARFVATPNTNRRRFVVSEGALRGVTWRDDALLGPVVTFPLISAGGTQFEYLGGTTDFDFIQDNAAFTIAVWIYSQNGATSATIIDSINNAATTPSGLIVHRVANSNLAVRITRNGSLFNNTTMGALSDATWYHIGLRCAGSGQPLRLNLTAFTSAAVTTISAVSSLATITPGGGSHPSANKIRIGSRANGTNPWNGSIVDCCIANAPWSDSDLQAHFDYTRLWATRSLA